MPLTWVDPEVFVKYRGIEVYRCYRNDNANEPLVYWFSTSMEDESDDDYRFDIRELPVPEGIADWQYDLIIMNAIDNRLIDFAEQEIEPLHTPDDWRHLPRHLLQNFIAEYVQLTKDVSMRFLDFYQEYIENLRKREEGYLATGC